MAGEIKRGFPEHNEEPKDDDTQFKPIMINTPAFSAEVMNLYDMPGEKVLEVFSTPGMLQASKMVQLFKLSMNDISQLEYIPMLTYSELTSVINQWCKKSAEISDPGSMDMDMFG
jgi:hypothetical protein